MIGSMSDEKTVRNDNGGVVCDGLLIKLQLIFV